MFNTLYFRIIKYTVPLVLLTALIILVAVFNSTSKTVHKNIYGSLVAVSNTIDQELRQVSEANNQKLAVVLSELQVSSDLQVVNSVQSTKPQTSPSTSDSISIQNALNLDVFFIFDKNKPQTINQTLLLKNASLSDGSSAKLAELITEKNYLFLNVNGTLYFLSAHDSSVVTSTNTQNNIYVQGQEVNAEFLYQIGKEIGLNISLVNSGTNNPPISTLENFSEDANSLRSSKVTENYLSVLRPAVLIGTQVLFTYEVPVENLVGEPSSLFLSINASRVSDNFIKLQSTIAVIAFIAVLIAALLSYYLSRRISKPIEALADHSFDISQGNYSTLQHTKSYSHEMTKLYNAFNKMQSSVAAREKEILIQAETDLQTNLYNRQYIANFVDKQLGDNKSFQAININISDFRSINDNFGNLAGDSCLEIVAQRLRPLGGICARITGAKFLWLPDKNISDEDLRELRVSLNKDVVHNKIPITLDISMGVLHCPDQASDIESFFKRLNILIEPAKVSTDSIAYFSDDIEKDYTRKIDIITQLKQSIDDKQDEFNICYQPYINIQDNKKYKLEALLRWHTPTLGSVAPDEFIKIAEDTGIITDITKLVVDRVFQDLSRLKENGFELEASINISANDLLGMDFTRFVKSKIENYKLDAKNITFELTESAFLNDIQKAITKMTEIKALGFSISIDDFGTGYSSLSYLSKLPADVLKIDKSFIISLTKSDIDKTLCKRIIQIAKDLSLQVVAEGIEDKESLEWLREQYCEWGQGFYICKPRSIDETLKWLADEFSSM